MSKAKELISKVFIPRNLWILFLGGAGTLFFLILILSFQDLPSFEELENPKSNLATELYANDGSVLGRLYTENRVNVEYQDLNPFLIDALVATEDVRYHQHSGIDFKALARVAIKTVFLQNRSAGGGSTITQQLAKLLYSDRNFSGMNAIQKVFALLSRKIKEWITAVKLERSYTKEEIIAMYLNKFNFINGAYGIESAAEIYFNKSQDSLQHEEAAVLVGMLKNPSLYNPVRRPEQVLQRRNTVILQSVKYNKLSEEIGDSLMLLPLDMSNFKRQSHITGLAPYFRQVVSNEVQAILEKEDYRKSSGEKYNIYQDGLKIYTTIDTAIQRLAEESVNDHMPNIQDKFWRSWRDMDPWTYENHETKRQELKIRQKTLNRLIRESDRFREYMIKRTIQAIDSLEIKFETSIRDYEIVRMIEHEQGESTFEELQSRGYLSSEKRKLYQKILVSPEWRILKKSWLDAEKEAMKIMNTPTKMKVFTYENPSMEKDTTMSPLDSIKYHRSILQIGSMAVDPLTGHVKAWVGGVNYKYYKYDHVTSRRQVGSTFKPVIYATAIGQQALSPCFQVYDVPYTIHVGESNFDIIEDWTPKNATGDYSGEKYTLKRGLKESKNTVSVYLMKQLGDTEPVRGLAHNMGIDSSAQYSNGRYVLPRQPSICLGSADLTVEEMAGAYTTFANNGIYNKPIYITRIEDKNGKLIFQHVPESKIALDPQTNYVMVEMLRNVVYGAGGFYGRKSDFGGKTGTTDKHVDGWFVGLTPNLVVSTWVGGEDPWIRFRSLAMGQGSVMARPYFAALLEKLEHLDEDIYDKKERFYKPPGKLNIELDCEVYIQHDSTKLKEVDMFNAVINAGDTSKINKEEFGGDFQ